MGTPNILIADDEDDTRTTLKDFLSKRITCKILEASNGYEVIEIIKKNNINVVLLDIVMPGVSGIETIKIIKDNSPKAHIFAITKLNSSEIARKISEAGADYIPKPLSLKIVLSKIEKVLTKNENKQ